MQDNRIMVEQTQTRKLLVLYGPSFEAQGILPLLREYFDVQVAENMDAALDVMRQEHFHAVMSDIADFLPLERGVVTQQASVVLDTIGDGVCIVGPSGELVWANRRMKNAPAKLLESLRSLCTLAFESFATAPPRDPSRGKRFSIMPEDGTYYEIICSPVRDSDGILRQVACVVVDATTQRRQQMKLNAIDRAGRELVRLDFEMLKNRDAQQRLQLLEERIIRCSRDVLSYEHFAVLLLDERTNRLEVVISDGLEEPADKYEIFASPDNNGICGYVASTGRSYICRDTRRDPRYLPGMTDPGSSLTVPLRLHDKVIGVLNAESNQPDAFGEEDRQFTEIFGNHVALALHILNLLVYERHTAHTQVSGSICAELSGPLNDIITDATEILEDYIGHDDLRKRLSALIDVAGTARQRVQQIQRSPSTGILAVPPSELGETDPVLLGKRVLVADDEEIIGQTIRDVLEPLGCQVSLATDGKAAIEMLGTCGYDLVISDIKMPGANGYQVFAAAKEINPDIPVILITGFGYDPHHSIVRARREGLAAVLMKPFKVKQLVEQCRTAIAGG